MILLPALGFDFRTVNRIVDAICKFVDIGRSHVHYVSHHQVAYMRKAADSLGEFEQLVLTSVLLLGDFVTVNKEPAAPWDRISGRVREVLKEC